MNCGCRDFELFRLILENQMKTCTAFRIFLYSSANWHLQWFAGTYRKEFFHLAKEHAEIHTSSAVLGAACTGWNHCQQHKNFKRSQDPIHARIFFLVGVAVDHFCCSCDWNQNFTSVVLVWKFMLSRSLLSLLEILIPIGNIVNF